MRKGFSLTEILVVVAILIILMAVGFPTLMNSLDSASKANTLSNLKQLCASAIMYAKDHNQRFPSGFAEGENEWDFNGLVPTPVSIPNKDETLKTPTHWSHVIRPYAKSYDIYNAPGIKETVTSENPEGKPCAFTYNGILHRYPMNGVESTSKTPLFWMGFGKTSIKGLATTNPYLVCNTQDTFGNCSYNSTSSIKTLLSRSLIPKVDCQTLWVFGKKTPVAHVDGSVKLRNLTKKCISCNAKGVPVAVRSSSQTRNTRSSSVNASPQIFKPDHDLDSF